MYDASDRKSIRKAEKAARQIELNNRQVLASLASTQNGRRYLWDRLTDHRVFETTYNDNPQRMAFLEGERNAGLKLLNDFMEWCPEEFILAMREANGRRTSTSLRDDDGAVGERPGAPNGGWDDQGLDGEPAERDLFD